MTAYAQFAGFYDQIMGDRSADIERVRDCIKRYRPGARSVLELGCGTGAVLAGLAADSSVTGVGLPGTGVGLAVTGVGLAVTGVGLPGTGVGLAVTGVDRSEEMLAVAARSVPAARLVRADVTSFSLGTRFDVAICVFDTLNHLPTVGAWRAMFERVHEHLADGGLFFFDVNTIGRLRRLWQGPAFAADFGENTMIMDVLPAGRGEGGDGELSTWTVRIFERIADDRFRLHEERIPELGLPLDTIRDALAANFDLLEESELDGGPVSDESNRVFFAFRHRQQA